MVKIPVQILKQPAPVEIRVLWGVDVVNDQGLVQARLENVHLAFWGEFLHSLVAIMGYKGNLFWGNDANVKIIQSCFRHKPPWLVPVEIFIII